MKTRSIKYNIPETHQALLEGLATSLDLSFDQLMTFLIEAGSEVYLDTNLPVEQMNDKCVVLLRQMKHRKEMLDNLIETKLETKR